ncbi:MAG TPA: ATP-binding protein [Rhabdochlamydiaceae bacterium]|nr:ATP-binding protein [Rhabdochlamydiaceae bacterium]
MKKIVGRKKEQKILHQIWNSKTAEFVAIYGRRRVGKTFLVREFFGSQSRYFELMGMKEAPLHDQLSNFAEAFSKTYYPGLPVQSPQSWRKAFSLLTKEMERSRSKKHLLFFDELPWLAAKKSRFIQALDYFWNVHWSRMPHVKIIVCGSAASWMLDHLINAKGGLHNRLTSIIHMEPFTLYETKEYLQSKKIRLSDKHLLDLYIVMGGIPHYLNYFDKTKSLEQNIQSICFATQGFLFTEFRRLFISLFDAAETNLRIIREIAQKKEGISREELLSKTGITSGGTFNRRLRELQAAGFIQSFTPYSYKKKQQYFRVFDEYSAFYLTWIDPIVDKGFTQHNYWKSCLRNPKWMTWSGYAFETVCLKHLPQILNALKLDSIPCEVGSWRFIPKKKSKNHGAQIDLLFDRQDQAITLCEIKYSSTAYTLDKTYAKELLRKMETFQEQTQTSKQLFLIMITTMGVKRGLWTDEVVSDQVTLKDLVKGS